MGSLVEPPPQKTGRGRSSIQEKVAMFYYTLGLFCINYPFCVLFIAGVIIFICWLPLLNLPFPGKAPLVKTTPINSTIFDEQPPFCYVQQVIMKVAVMPWENDMKLGDAFRGPLYEVFKVLEVVRNYQDESSSKTLGHVCFHIESTKRAIQDQSNVLPQYSCLVLSPANLWNQDVQQFSQDNSLLHTIFNHHSIQKGKISVAEMLFGMHLLETGIRRYPLKNRQRIIQYAVTLFYKDFDQKLIGGLKNKLISLYPLHQNATKTAELSTNDVVIIQYSGELNYIELIPICAAFVLIFFYYYFSVRKINIITSKLGMAFTATLTIFCSLTMTMGICFFFGLTLALDERKGVFPYLALLIGLENALVLTKSVSSTPFHLDVKIRTAQGVSKEGWYITKNLMLEITVLTIGLFTFVPAIQEFCIFSIVTLLTDFFLQMFFFLTILGLDISRSVIFLEKNNHSLYQPLNLFEKSQPTQSLQKSRSHPRLSTYPTNIVANQAQNAQQQKIPKRVRLVNVWARTRFFQRSFMFIMLIWISIMLYKSDILNQYITKVINDNQNKSTEFIQNQTSLKWTPLINFANDIPMNYVTYRPIEVEYQRNLTQEIEKLKYSDPTPWNRLSTRLWPAIFRKYNISLRGQMIVILPNIKLSHVVRPEQVALLRNPNEKDGIKFQWQALAAALDPLDFSDFPGQESYATKTDQPFYPTSPMEIFLTTILCLISVIVQAYILVVIYRCVCSRNYAEWRASWNSDKIKEVKEERFLLEAVPVVVEGHQQQIECLATDGKSIISACLGGQLKLWDANTGELSFSIDRKTFFEEKLPNMSSEESLVSESGSPLKEVSFPKLMNKINTDFSYSQQYYCSSPTSKTDFDKSYDYFYTNHHHGMKNDNRKVGVGAADNVKHNSKDVSRTNGDLENNSFDSSDSSKASFNRQLSDCDKFSDYGISQIWCIDYLNNLIVAGCADGRLEFWEVNTNKLKAILLHEHESGITHLKIVGSKITVVRLCGTLELFQLQSRNQGSLVDWNFSCAYRRTHVRTGSVGSVVKDMNTQSDILYDDELSCQRLYSVRAHQQSINCLDCEGGRIVTGSQDHTLKVFRLEDASVVCRLLGHSGPITSLFIDRVNPALSGSGSLDGLLCMWDLITGACMYSIQAHNGSITSLTYSASYVISLGTDDRLCIWERFQGHLLNTINISQMFSNQIVMLGQHLVVTSKNGGLIIWDVRNGECVKSITLGRAAYVFINHLVLLPNAVLCDYGNQLRIVRFPSISHKFD